MPKSHAEQTIEQIDELLQTDQLTTRSGLRLAFSALRDAITVVSSVGAKLDDLDKKVDTLWAVGQKMDDIGKKVETLWMFYRVVIWIAGALGLSIIALIWALITGQAEITFR